MDRYRNLSIHNLSKSLDKNLGSMKSIRTNSTNETHRIDSFVSDSLSNKNFSTLGAISTDSNKTLKNIIKKTDKSSLKKYLETEPNKSSINLLTSADKILKARKNNQNIIYSQFSKNIFMKKENEMCLNNHKIRLMYQKRKELAAKAIAINNALKSNEKQYLQTLGRSSSQKRCADCH